MKIDVHTHTKKIKSGDAVTRNITAQRFEEIIKNTEVKILAVTNHNHFDLKQYEELRDCARETCSIWPGIELDIIENGNRAHLLVIVNPRNYVEFDEKAKGILDNKSADTFSISIKETVDTFDSLDCLYIAHYMGKKPDLGDTEIELLRSLTRQPKRVLKEAANSLSAGIYISHGHNSIYGSDVQDWDKYETDSKDLPELRLPVESFEQFCLLLEKDEVTIHTLLNKKIKENIEINPFSVAEIIRLDIYNDINILFGSKGTGKTEILEALSKYYNGLGHQTTVYKSNDKHLNDAFDLRGQHLNVSATDLGLNECIEEIDFIKNATDQDVTNLSKYELHFSSQETNKISQKLKIKNISKADETQAQRHLRVVKGLLLEFKKFNKYVRDSERLPDFVNSELIEELIAILEKIILKLSTSTEDKYFDAQSTKMLNSIIDIFNQEISKKTGQPQKPTLTGFSRYASNRIQIEMAVNKVKSNIITNLNQLREYAGNLGDKGDLFCLTEFKVQNGFITDSNFSPLHGIRKNHQKEFGKKIDSVSRHIYTNDLFEKISQLNQIEGIELITKLSDLVLFFKYFTLNGNRYSPSNGESSMILLHKELKDDKDIYLIDEPEKSLGNDYINDVIVPLLKEKALLGKKIIIATHDANIAVRTLPYNSIYRLREDGTYYTMVGNPFSNSLKCIYSSRTELDWKEISMKTLEGGKAAFGERGKIYGN